LDGGRVVIINVHTDEQHCFPWTIAKWAEYIFRYWGCIQVSRRKLWCQAGRYNPVWTICWQWPNFGSCS